MSRGRRELTRWLLLGIAGLGPDFSSGSSSPLLVHVAAREGQAGAPAAAQRRGRTSLRPASGDGSWEAGKIVFVLVLQVRVGVPGRGGRSGLTSTHPAPHQRAGGCHDHVSGDRAAQSEDRARALAAWLMPQGRACPELGDLAVLGAAAADAALAAGVLVSVACIPASRWEARVSSLRAIAMVAIFLPRRLAMAA